MNLLLQRVTQAAVLINKQETARIGQGLLIMVGFTDQDTSDTSFRATKKIISYALFSDSKGRIKKNIKEVSGEILLVPEITLSVKTNTGNKPNFSEGVGKLAAPSREHKHYLGTDDAGRDIAARLFYGFRIVMLFALGFTFMVFLVGSALGCLMGYFGGKVDLFGLRLVEIWANIPFLYMVMIMVSVLPSKVGMMTRILMLLAIMVVFSWTSMTYYMRASTYKEKARDYVSAAQLLGAGPFRIIFTHLYLFVRFL